MSINKCMISGNLTRDPELRGTAGGSSILTFGVAVNDRRKNQQTGQWEDYPNYIDCTMFGNRAEAVSRFLGKGTKVAIEGRLHWSSWEKDGQKRSKVEVIVDEIEFLSRQQGGQPQQYQQAPMQQRPQQFQQAPQQFQQAPQQFQQAPQQFQQAPMQQAPVPQQPAMDIFDEDIPF